MSQRCRVLLAERDGPTRAGLRMALSGAGFEVVAEARDSESAVEAALEQRPDVALVSTDLPGGGIDVARAVAGRLPGTKVIVLSPRPGGQELLAAVLAGAVGYLSKEISPERLPHALKGVLRGEVALPRRYTQRLLDDCGGARSSGPLSRHKPVPLSPIASGRSSAFSARAPRRRRWRSAWSISEVTVRRHVSSLLGKLGVADRASAARMLRRSAN